MAAGLLDLTWGLGCDPRSPELACTGVERSRFGGETTTLFARGRTHGAANGLGMNALLS